jgi:hypothetical protein
MISIKCKNRSTTTICSTTSKSTPVFCQKNDKDTIFDKSPCENLGYDSYNCCQSNDNNDNDNDNNKDKDTYDNTNNDYNNKNYKK